jgi:hypothetical protein
MKLMKIDEILTTIEYDGVGADEIDYIKEMCGLFKKMYSKLKVHDPEFIKHVDKWVKDGEDLILANERMSRSRIEFNKRTAIKDYPWQQK